MRVPRLELLRGQAHPRLGGGATAQRVANPADLLLEGRGAGAKPGFRRSRKCAQMRISEKWHLYYSTLLEMGNKH
jgi:hypothetical protein